MQNDKLLPCPFCGGEAIKSAFSWGNITDEYTIECTICSTRTKVLKLEDAIKQWNTRKPMEQILERLEEQRKEYTELTRIPSMGLPQESYYSGLARGFELSQDYVRNGGKE